MVENEEDESLTKIRRNTRKTELAFCKVYYEAIRKLLDFREEKNAMHLRRYFRVLHFYSDTWCMFRSFADENVNDMRRILNESLYYRISYIFRNSTILSSAVAFHFRNVLRENSLLLQKLLKKKSVKICSVGGGSASDIVAIVIVLESIAYEKGVQLDVQVSIIDGDEKWKNTCITVLSCLEQFYKATWKINFIKADLSQPFSLETVQAIRDADIVTVVKFLSEYIRTERDLKDLFREVCNSTQPMAILFVLDCAQFRLITECGGNAAEIDNFHLLYQEINDLHTLEQVTMKKIFYLYHRLFKGNISNSHLYIFVRVWIKESCGRSTMAVKKYNNNTDKHHEKYNAKQSYLNINSFKQFKASRFNIKDPRVCVGYTEEIDDILLYQDIHKLHRFREDVVKKIFRLYPKIFNGSRRNSPLNKFVKVWFDESCGKNTMAGSKYRQNFDTCNEISYAKQNSRNINSFNNRKASFCNIKEQREWNKKRVQKIMLEHKGRIEGLLMELIRRKKLVEFNEKAFLKQIQEKEREKDEVTDDDDAFKLRKYFIEKSRISLIKKEIYCTSLSDLYFVLKFKNNRKREREFCRDSL